VSDATVVGIDVGPFDIDEVQVNLSGGSGTCASGTLLLNPNNSSNWRVQGQLQLVLTAFLTGNTINAWDNISPGEEVSCSNASSIFLN
jgi:Family of unknown function (DUF5992)